MLLKSSRRKFHPPIYFSLWIKPSRLRSYSHVEHCNGWPVGTVPVIIIYLSTCQFLDHKLLWAVRSSQSFTLNASRNPLGNDTIPLFCFLVYPSWAWDNMLQFGANVQGVRQRQSYFDSRRAKENPDRAFASPHFNNRLVVSGEIKECAKLVPVAALVHYRTNIVARMSCKLPCSHL